MKKTIFLLTFSLSLLLLNTACMTNRHTVADGPIGKEDLMVEYSNDKQVYVFWGLIPINKPNPRKPALGEMGYQVKTSYNVVDALVTGLTLGIVSMRTIRIYVRPDRKRKWG